ncbi:MAG: hypothetical protein N2318_09975 [Meiothermus sp.]|nr:hypothetical protein [Meiothermus sp.]
MRYHLHYHAEVTVETLRQLSRFANWAGVSALQRLPYLQQEEDP